LTREQPRGLDLLLQPARVEASLWRRLRDGAGAACREALFNRYVGLARAIAGRYFHSRQLPQPELSDYQQFAYTGLLQAIDRFDPLRGVPFQGFAQKRIAGSISDGVARMTEFDAQLSQRRRIESERIRSLRMDGIDQAETGEAIPALAQLAAGLAIGLILEGTALVTDEHARDPRPSAYDSLEFRQLQARLVEAVRTLPQKESAVITQHYLNGLSFTHISELMALSRGRISQLHHSALKRLRKRIGTLD
jgi:RNA polymerase sigma factor for flagellar operon FliA